MNALGFKYSDPLNMRGVRFAVAMQREPMKSFFTPHEIANLTEAAGYQVVRDLSARAHRQMDLHGRRDGLDVPQFARLLQLRIP